MLETGKMMELISELKRYDISVAALQEIRWSGKGEIKKKDCTIIYSGEKKSGQKGVAFMIFGELKNKIIETKMISGRLAYLRIQAKPYNISLLNIYAPTENADKEDKDTFYEEMERAMDAIPKEDAVLLLGDFNAQIGKEKHIEHIAGKHTIHNKTNNNGQMLCEFATKNNLIISSTKFKHPREHKITWTSPDQQYQTQIDHVLINKRRQSSIKDVRTYRGACADSDHFLVLTKLRLKLRRNIKKRRLENKWDIRKFEMEKTRKEYRREINKLIENNQKTEENVDVIWIETKDIIKQAASKTVGHKKKSVKKEWYDENCAEELKKKIEARLRWLRTKKPEHRIEYEKARKNCNKTIKKSKKEKLIKELEEIEQENRNTRNFYQKIKNQNHTYKPQMRGIKNKNGRLVEGEEEITEVWKVYFEELLNKREETPIEIENEVAERAEIEEPSLMEVFEIINKSRNLKAPGKDSINAELLKYGSDTLKERIYKLILKIWREEKMPEDWKVGQIITIHKKGNQQDCKNYRGITLLSTVYKILTTLIKNRLQETTVDKVGQYQFGFVKGRSTIDAIHTLKQCMEKSYRYQINLELLFIDFQQAFDSIHRSKLIEAMKVMEIPIKLRRLIAMTMDESKATVKTNCGESEEFKINTGVRQGDTISAIIFNIALEYVTRKINKGTLRTRGGQLIGYADDVVILAKRRDIMVEMLQEIITEGKKMGLEINKQKTKFMRIGNGKVNNNIRIGEHTFEEVEKFKYLGITIANDGSREAEIKEKIIKANKSLHANKKLLKSKDLSRNTKLKIYKTVIRPSIMYAAETMSMTKKDEEDLRVAERRILRTILGPIRIGINDYRRRTNIEIIEKCGNDIVTEIKKQRARWQGHIWRLGEDDMVRIITDWEPGGRKRRGRPRSSWTEEVKEDLKRTGAGNLKDKARNRREWRKICQRIE